MRKLLLFVGSCAASALLVVAQGNAAATEAAPAADEIICDNVYTTSPPAGVTYTKRYLGGVRCAPVGANCAVIVFTQGNPPQTTIDCYIR